MLTWKLRQHRELIICEFTLLGPCPDTRKTLVKDIPCTKLGIMLGCVVGALSRYLIGLALGRRKLCTKSKPTIVLVHLYRIYISNRGQCSRFLRIEKFRQNGKKKLTISNRKTREVLEMGERISTPSIHTNQNVECSESNDFFYCGMEHTSFYDHIG